LIEFCSVDINRHDERAKHKLAIKYFKIIDCLLLLFDLSLRIFSNFKPGSVFVKYASDSH
jgi:hypothetical protein